jgi:nucleoside-diphosphate-sugar epimerase
MKDKYIIYLTGSNGFVGKNIVNYFLGKHFIVPLHLRYIEDQEISIDNSNVLIHLGGVAHDLQGSLNYDHYINSNYKLTKQLFDSFINSDATTFIFFSTVKAVAENINGVLKEDFIANPKTFYGKSKLMAEEYILTRALPKGKKVFVLRPCMIHGPGVKGNFKLLFSIIRKNIPWPLGAFENLRSFCSIENLCFVLIELIERNDIPSGVYNVADDSPISTNDVVQIISNSLGKKPLIYKIPPIIIRFLCKIGDRFNFTFNSNRLEKLTESYIVSNEKIKSALNKELPVDILSGLKKTIIDI